MGESFSVEGATARAKGRPNPRRSQSTLLDQAAVVLCCCNPRWGRSKYDAIEGNGNTPEDVLRTKGRWEVDEDDEFYKPPVWKQIILKVKAQARQANCGGTNAAEWVNYDSQSYEKNFDDGLWRDTSRNVFQENVVNENLALKERALHTALLTKFASSRPHKLADGGVESIISDPDLSPLPVRSATKPNDDFVPIWQRRASSPVTLDVRQRS